jgi:hypothetical protein
MRHRHPHPRPPPVLAGGNEYWGWEGDEDEDEDDEAPDLLLFQDSFGDGTVHLWARPAAARRHDYSDCWASYSGG